MSEKLRKTLFFMVLGCVFAVMLTLNLLTPMIADDYRYAFSFATGERLQGVGDIIPSLLAHAREVNGRITPHFFVQLFTLFPRQAFGAVNALVYIAFLLGLYWLTCGGRRYDVRLFMCLAGAVFVLPPAFGQSFLWMSGSANYLWCDTLMIYLLIPFADALFRGRDKPKLVTRILLCLGAFAFGNMSENVSAAAVVLMFLCIVWLLVRKRRVCLWMPLTAVCAAAGWLVLMLAPGNRQSLARASGGMGAMMEQLGAAVDMFLAFGLWPSVVFFGLLCLCLYWKADPDRVALAVGLFVCALLCNFAMTASDYYPGRAFTGTCVMLIAACAALLCALPRRGAPLKSALALSLAFSLALCALGALPDAYNRYALARARAQEVCVRRDAGELDITTFGILGRSRFDAFDGLNELTNDVGYFPNVYYAKYYGLQTIVIDRME